MQSGWVKTDAGWVYQKAGKQKVLQAPRVVGIPPSVSLNKRVRKLEKVANAVEYKVIETHGSDADCYNGGAGKFFLCNGINQGDGISSRDGRQIVNKTIRFKLSIQPHASQTATMRTRVIMFIDLEPHGTAPTITQVLNTSAAGPEEAFRNLDHRDRFIILKDKVYNVDPGNNSTGINYHFINFVKYKKLKNLKTLFNSGNAATIADIQRGAVYVWVYDAQGATYPFSLHYCGRLRFIDP